MPDEPVPSKEELFERFLDVQSKEVELRKEEIELKKKDMEYSYGFSTKALDAKAADNENRRAFLKGLINWSLVTAGILFVILVGFMAYALKLGKDSIVLEIIKIVALVGGGFLGGYGVGKSRKKIKDDSSADDES